MAMDACFKSQIQRDSQGWEGRNRRAVSDIWEWRRSRGSLLVGGDSGRRRPGGPHISPPSPPH